MAYIPYAPEYGITYELTNSAGVRAVFNNSADADYVGFIGGDDGITGLDSADVRESAMELVEADGGAHGNFYLGRRPIVINATVYGHATMAARSTKIDKAMRASMALRSDSTLKWTTSLGAAMYVPVRRQQPFRATGGWNKKIQIPLVSQWAVIFGQTLKTTAAMSMGGSAVTGENQGNFKSYPVLTITGPTTNPTLTNQTTSEAFTTTGLTMVTGETVQFDLSNHTGVFTAGARNGQSANRYINFATTKWPSFSGNGVTDSFALSGTGSATATLAFRDVWA